MVVSDDKYLKISYGVVGSLVTLLVMIGIWVGTHATRLSNVEARADRQSQFIQETNTKVDGKFEKLEGRIYDLWKALPPDKRTAPDE